MKIVLNPADGAPISDFIYKGAKLDTHYPAGYTTPQNTISKGLLQYEDDVADSLIETFGFLEIIDEAKAKQILEKKDEEFKCDFPGCDFVSNKKIGLLGHQRSHEKSRKELEKPAIDPSIVPIAKTHLKTETESVFGKSGGGKPIDTAALDIPNGIDKDGVEWSGEGLTVENKSAQSFSKVRKPGQAHFVG